MDRDVVLGLSPWPLVVLKDKSGVLGPGLEPCVLVNINNETKQSEHVKLQQGAF